MDDPADILRHQVSSGLCVGAQVAAIDRSGPRTWSVGTDGLGRPIEDGTISAVYCASKPLLAFAVHALMSERALSPSTTVGEILGLRGTASPLVAVSALLNHTAGLHAADGETLKLRGSIGKQSIARRAVPPHGWSSERDAGYSEYVAWSVLAEVVGAVAGEPWQRIVDRYVIAPAGASDEVFPVIDRSSYLTLVDRIRVNMDLRDRPTPLLNERGPTFACEANPGYGAYASARGLATVVHEHLTQEHLSSKALADSQQRRGYRWDEVMHARVDTQNGLLVDLPSYGVIGASSDSIGHTGLMGLTTVVHEPIPQTTVVITYFGLIDGPTATGVRRPDLLRCLSA